MKKYRNFIFDLDGTLIDTSPGLIEAIPLFESLAGLEPVSLKDRYKIIGPTFPMGMKLLYPELPESRYPECEKLFNHAYEQTLTNVKVYPLIPEILGFLKERGARIGVYTAKPDYQTEMVFKSAGLYEKFDYISGCRPGTDTKVKLLKDVIDHFGCGKGDSCTVGDSRFDGSASKELCIDHYAVTYGFGYKDREEALEYDALGVFESTGGLFEFIRSSVP